MLNNTRLVILIPAYNESAGIESVLAAMPHSLDRIESITCVVVDDGSTDGTGEIAEHCGACVVRHGRNRGVAEAFRTGVRTALELDADIAVSIDADRQFSPDEIPRLIEPILDGQVDFTAGDRFRTGKRPKDMSRVKYHGNRVMTGIVGLISGEHFTDVSSGYRAYSREALLNLNVQSSFTYTQESFIELTAKGFAIAQVPVTVRYFPDRRSRVVTSVLRYSLRTFLTIARTTRDYMPLAVFGFGAVCLAVPGVALAVFVLIHYAMTGSFSPYIFLAFTAVYLFTLGAALFVLGLVADMLRATRNNQERLLYFAKVNYYKRKD